MHKIGSLCLFHGIAWVSHSAAHGPDRPHRLLRAKSAGKPYRKDRKMTEEVFVLRTKRAGKPDFQMKGADAQKQFPRRG
jgi:hypothetical protein